MRALSLGLTLALAAFASPVLAQNGPPGGPPVVGTVQSFDGTKLTVTTADGKTVSVMLADDVMVTQNKKGSFASIKPGDFVASAAVDGPDGKTHAQELRIFPEPMRGRGEGHRPMTQPNQTMTNATVAEVVATGGNNVVKTKYPGGTTDIVVDPTTPVTIITMSDKSALKPGAAVSVRATTSPDGKMNAAAVTLQ